MSKQRSVGGMGEVEGEEATFTCRICFEEDCKPSELISPCRCKGTLKYVHQSCLHRWQANVQRLGGKRDERATVCGVCRTAYTSLPPKAAMHVWCKVWSCTKGLIGAICISLLALCLSGPPLLHLLLLLMLLLSSRSQSVLVLLVMMLGGVMASLYARGLRLVLRSEGDMRLGLAVIRHGAAVQGLGTGSLLVAHHSSLDGTFFAQSVVLLTEQNSRGAKGVVLTQPMETIDSQLWNHQLAERLSHSSPIRHFLGGPVGLPNQSGPASQTVVLHHVPHIQGAAAVIPPPPAAAEAGEGMLGHQQHQPPPQQQQRVTWGGTRVIEPRQHERWWQQQQQQGWCPGWLGFCFTAHADDHHQQQQGTCHSTAVPAAATATAAAAAAMPGSSMSGRSATSSRSAEPGGLGLYQGGSLDELLRAVLQYNSAAPAATTAPPRKASTLASKLRGWNRSGAQHSGSGAIHFQQQQGSSSSSSSSRSRSRRQQQQAADDLTHLQAAVRMYHGVCSWSTGQLEGEIRAGAWGVIDQADVSDVVETPPQLLWQQLVHSNRPRWF